MENMAWVYCFSIRLCELVNGAKKTDLGLNDYA
jgi:hypothetical protein